MATVRAMGGTLNFTLTIGNTTWTKKSDKFNPKEMYNTRNIDWNKKLDEFEGQLLDELNNRNPNIRRK